MTASSGASSGSCDVLDVQRLARVLVGRLDALEHVLLVLADDDRTVRLGKGKARQLVAARARRDGLEDVLHASGKLPGVGGSARATWPMSSAGWGIGPGARVTATHCAGETTGLEAGWRRRGGSDTRGDRGEGGPGTRRGDGQCDPWSGRGRRDRSGVGRRRRRGRVRATAELEVAELRRSTERDRDEARIVLAEARLQATQMIADATDLRRRTEQETLDRLLATRADLHDAIARLTEMTDAVLDLTDESEGVPAAAPEPARARSRGRPGRRGRPGGRGRRRTRGVDPDRGRRRSRREGHALGDRPGGRLRLGGRSFAALGDRPTGATARAAARRPQRPLVLHPASASEGGAEISGRARWPTAVGRRGPRAC